VRGRWPVRCLLGPERTHVVVGRSAKSTFSFLQEGRRVHTLRSKRRKSRRSVPPSRVATLGLCRYRRRSCVATRGGSAVAFSIHRAGVPVVGGLSRFRRPPWATHCSESGGTSGTQRRCAFQAKSGRGLWRNGARVEKGCAKTGMQGAFQRAPRPLTQLRVRLAIGALHGGDFEQARRGATRRVGLANPSHPSPPNRGRG
jgi:hypothetical protein